MNSGLRKRHLDDDRGLGINIYQAHGYDKSEGARGLAEWMEARERDGYSLYYINFMFAKFPGPRDAVLHQMRRSIHQGFYAPLCRLSAHHPKAAGERHRLPEAILMPDLPVHKASGGALLYGNANGGYHYNGPFLISPSSRFKRPLDEYARENSSCFRRRGIARIDVRPANRTLEHLADYATKTVKRGLVSLDDIYVLPLSGSEMRRDAKPLTPHEKAIKDIEASANFSPEFAEAIYRSSRQSPSLSHRDCSSGAAS
jgi:hypothetical protein